LTTFGGGAATLAARLDWRVLDRLAASAPGSDPVSADRPDAAPAVADIGGDG